MNTILWVSDDFEVQFGVVKSLPSQVEEEGFVRRAYGISDAVLDHIAELGAEEIFLTGELAGAVVEAEQVALSAMEILREEETGDVELDLPAGAYFQSVGMIIEPDGTGVGIDVFVVVNTRRNGTMQFGRFIAMLLPCQSNAYIEERGG